MVVGARGALGRAVCSSLARAGWAVTGVVSEAAAAATARRDADAEPPMTVTTMRGARDALRRGGTEAVVDAVVSVAGGFRMATELDDEAVAREMWRANVLSALEAAACAREALPRGGGGVLVLTGSADVIEGKPMAHAVHYALAKAAVHRLADTLASPASPLPPRSRVVLLLPRVLDTPANRAAMPTADTSSWTPLSVAADAVVRDLVSASSLRVGSVVRRFL